MGETLFITSHCLAMSRLVIISLASLKSMAKLRAAHPKMTFTRPVLALALLALLPISAARGDEAVNARLNAAHTGSSITGVMSPALTQAWSADLGGTVQGTVIQGTTIYVVTLAPNNSTSLLSALDASTGATLWGPVGLQAYVAQGIPAYSSGRLFIVTTSGTMRAFDAGSGLPLWSTSLSTSGFTWAPPTAANGLVYASGASHVYAVDQTSGQLVWSAASGTQTTPTVSAEGVYVGYQGNQLSKFDPATGAPVWSYSYPNYGYDGASTELYRDRVYLLDNSSTGNLVVDATSGTRIGTFPGNFAPALALDDGYFVSPISQQNTLQRRNLLTGSSAWSFTGDGSLTGSPVYLNGFLYIVSSRGQLFGVDAAGGQQVWSADLSTNLTSNYFGNSAFYPISAAHGFLAVPLSNILTVFTYAVTPVPLLDLAAIDSIGGRSASFSAGVNPNGLDTQAHLEYGLDATYGGSTPSVELGSGITAAPLSGSLAGLSTGTLYHYRVVAANSAGTTHGLDQTFTTGAEAAPLEKVNIPTASSATTATVNGAVDPNGLPTQACFEYGTTLAYGSQTPLIDVGAFHQWYPIAADLVGLNPNTAYHYRVTATNSAGTSSSADQTFLTPPVQAPLALSQSESETAAGVTLTATIDPNGGATTCHFKYEEGYSSTWLATPEIPVGGGSATSVTVSAALPVNVPPGGLSYYVVATNSAGSVSSASSYVTVRGDAFPVLVNTLLPSARDSRSVSLHGTVSTAKSANAWFEYGATSSYGQISSSVHIYPALSAPVDIGLVNLLPSTAYHYRLVLLVGDTTYHGDDQTFSTTRYSTVVSAYDDLAFVAHGQPVTVSVLDNDTNTLDESISLTSIAQGSYGTATFDASAGTITYTPGRHFPGVDIVRYTVTNFSGDTASASLILRSLEPVVAGTYTSLIADPNGSAYASTGQITVTLTSLGSFTGSLKLGGTSWPLRGHLGADGFDTLLAAPRRPLVHLTFQVDPLSASLSGAATYQTGLDEPSFVFECTKCPWSADAPAPQKGSYTVVIPPVSGTSGDGYGYALMKVAATGAVSMVGKMNNGAAISLSSMVNDTASFPIYTCLDAATQISLAGTLTFRSFTPPYNDYSSLNSDLDGSVSWFTPEASNQGAGPSFTLLMQGSIFRTPAKGDLVVGFNNIADNGTLTLAPQDDYSIATSVSLTLAKGGSLQPTDPHGGALHLSVNPRSGLLSGTFTDPTTHQSSNLAGVAFQTNTGFYGLYRNRAGLLGALSIAGN